MSQMSQRLLIIQLKGCAGFMDNLSCVFRTRQKHSHFSWLKGDFQTTTHASLKKGKIFFKAAICDFFFFGHLGSTGETMWTKHCDIISMKLIYMSSVISVHLESCLIFTKCSTFLTSYFACRLLLRQVVYSGVFRAFWLINSLLHLEMKWERCE